MPYDTVEKHIRFLLAKKLIVRKGGKKTGGYYLIDNELNEPVEKTFEFIKDNQGCNSTQISEQLNVPYRTIVKHIDVLIAKSLVERRGSKKTGGYYLK